MLNMLASGIISKYSLMKTILLIALVLGGLLNTTAQEKRFYIGTSAAALTEERKDYMWQETQGIQLLGQELEVRVYEHFSIISGIYFSKEKRLSAYRRPRYDEVYSEIGFSSFSIPLGMKYYVLEKKTLMPFVNANLVTRIDKYITESYYRDCSCTKNYNWLRTAIEELDTIYEYPEQVGIIIHENNGSTTEQFLLAAKQSKKSQAFWYNNSWCAGYFQHEFCKIAL